MLDFEIELDTFTRKEFQSQIDLADEIHHDECEAFKAEIALLTEIVNAQNQMIINQQHQIQELER